ncbi:MAG: ATP-binding protein [Melioribacteraceae bacterium]|nr:ATP-binding protein [Melioribacteraceae bacterium]
MKFLKYGIILILIPFNSILTKESDSLHFKESSLIVEIKNYRMEDGLPSLNVEEGIQDSRGFLWFPTKYGLTHFDGKEFKAINSEKNGLEIKRVFHIAEDNNSKIWLKSPYSTQKIDILDVKTLEVKNIEEVYPTIKNVKDSKIHFFSANNHFYLLTQNGTLYKKDENNEFKSIYITENVGKFVTSRYLRFGRNGFWFNYDEITIRYVNYDGVVKDIYKGNNLNKPELIGVDSNDNLLFTVIPEIDFGDGKSYKSIPSNKKRINQIIYKATTSGTITKIDQKLLKTTTPLTRPETRFFQDKRTGIILGISKTIGVVLIKPNLNWEVIIPPNNIENYPGISRSYALFDNLDNIWVSTRTQGIYKIIIKENRFSSYLRLKDLPRTLNEFDSKPKGIYVDKNENLYSNSSTSLYKISMIDKNKPIKILNDWSGLALTKIENKLYAGSNGLFVFNENDKVIDLYKFDFNEKQTESYKGYYSKGSDPNQNIWSVYKSKSGKMWVGINKGLFYYDFTKNKFIKFPLNEKLKNIIVYQIFNSHDGKLWAVTSIGLFQIDKSGKSIRYWKGGNNSQYIPSDYMYNIHEDSDGVFWIATNGDGLIEWNRNNKSYKVYRTADGLSANTLFSVLEDDYNKLWISSSYGLNSLNKTSGEIDTYSIKDGLSSNEFSSISYYKNTNGRLYFGTVDGVNSFDPKDFLEEEKEYNIPLRIISFNQFEDEEDKLVDKTKELVLTNKIILHSDDKFFTLQFSLLNYEDGKNKYAYLLEGFDNKWHYINENSIRISNLNSGDYKLRIKGQNHAGKWSTNQLNINIEVLTPFYVKLWFIVLLVFSIGILIISFYQYRIRQSKKEMERLETEVKKRTKKIESDKKIIMQQTIELKELDVAKTRLFANISHELRTPLTLILGPLDALLKGHYGNLHQKTKKIITRAARNGNRLLELIEQILDLSSLEAGKLIINEKPIELTKLIDRTESTFKSLAESKDIIWRVVRKFDGEINFMLDDDKFDKIVFNLLSNAFKFTQTGGEISLTVSLKKKDEIIFVIEDNGKGIPTEDLPKIFDRFFQSSTMNESNIGGSGIGLAFAKELSTALGGNLSVESKLGKGIKFILELPLKKPSLELKDAIIENEIANRVESLSSTIDEPPTTETEEDISLTQLHTVLIVEDNLDLREFITEVLSKSYSIITAGDGVEALELLNDKSNNIDFILSDIMMPRMDGFTLLEKVKADDEFKKLPMVLLTAKATPESKIKALRIGVDDYIYKPFLPEELLARVKNLLFYYEQRNVAVTNLGSVEPDNLDKQEFIEHDLLWLEKAEKVCRDNVKSSIFNVNEFANQMLTSERQIHRTIKKITGLSPAKYMREIKLKIAMELIDNDSFNSLAEISYEIGFERTDYFIKLYTQRFGIPPKIKNPYN